TSPLSPPRRSSDLRRICRLGGAGAAHPPAERGPARRGDLPRLSRPRPGGRGRRGGGAYQEAAARRRLEPRAGGRGARRRGLFLGLPLPCRRPPAIRRAGGQRRQDRRPAGGPLTAMADRNPADAASDLVERAEGCLIGGLIGDAMGTPSEGLEPDEIERRFGWIDRFSGDGTDDSIMKYLLADALIAT